ncbi:MAG: DNA polymerase III subunit alpha [Deltaproteobacteria bacterium]|nr:DNA polymerase III subunit alpha [Deltaproteobacteria bacterium]
MTPFAHLHLHTQYSLLDGVNKLPNVIEQAHALGQPAIAMTDHGNMHGAIQFYDQARNVGIKPIIGCELYVTPGSRHERKTRAQGGAGTHHLTVLAANNQGYQNLCRLVTLAYREGFYFKPRVDHELLEEYSEGVIALSGCLAGELNRHVEIDDFKSSKALLEFYLKTFGDRFYLEVQPHMISEQQRLNTACFDLAKDMSIPVVATNDCHYGSADDHYAQEVLMCVSTGKQITDPDRIRHEGVHLHLKKGEEVLEGLTSFSRAEEALRNTVEIANRCNVEFDFNTYYMPRFQGRPNDDLSDDLRKVALLGLEKRIEEKRANSESFTQAKENEYRERLELELETIISMGFPGYFLIVSDFIVWAKENGIPVGPGRGSCAGSLVSYAMRITEIDPIENKLLFERFLNPERVSLPDIDVDFCIYGRDKVIQYVVEQYGKEKVAQIGTFGTLKAKAAIKDVGRALGMSYAETDRIAKLIPAPRQGFDFSLTESLKMEKRLADYAKGEGRELIELALKLEGLVRHTSTHAAGVVIGDRPLIDMLPLMVDKDGNDVTQFAMGYVEKIGLVKFDFLGLKTLTVIHTALKLIEESQGVKIDLDNLPLDDPKTYALLCAGNTTGVFQLESSGITDMTKRLKPSCFDDLTAILALYRPGPLDAGMVDRYIGRKHGSERVDYLHPLMTDILADTYGIIVYQEQIMQLARTLAGYSLGEADLLRRAMGKKKPEEMAKQRIRFVAGAKEKGIDQKLATEIFDQMETFARYGFNRSHSAAYAMISFQTAYLKAHYKVEFMAALMSHEMGDSDKTLKNLTECREQSIEVLPPDVNYSSAGFSANKGRIRFGLEAVKGIGEKAVQKIIEAREAEGKFSDLEDLLMRVDPQSINRRVIESLVKCGAFDFSEISRSEMYARVEELLKASASFHREKDTNQIGLFGGDAGLEEIPRRRLNQPEWPINKKLAFEREALGFYISGHPLEKFKKELKRIGVSSTRDVLQKKHECKVRVSGVVTALRLKNTRKGDRYASFVLEDWLGTLETLVWPDVYRQIAHILAAEDPVVLTGKLDVGDDRHVIIAENIESLIDIRDTTATIGIMELEEAECNEPSIEKLSGLLKSYPGSCPVKIRIDHVPYPVQLKDDRDAPICVQPSETLCEAVEQLFGRPVLSFY